MWDCGVDSSIATKPLVLFFLNYGFYGSIPISILVLAAAAASAAAAAAMA